MITERDLDAGLRSLAAAVDWPDTADVAPAVRKVVQRPVPRHRRLIVPARRRPALAAVALMSLAVTAVLAVSPATRTAVARLLGFPGVAVEVGSQPLPQLQGIDLGREVSLTEAERRTGLDLRQLPLPAYGIYLDQQAGAVHSAYQLPRGGVALLTQLRGGVEPAFLKQSPDVLPTRVHDDFALWVAGGGEHAVMRAGGTSVEARLSENALLWASDGITYRLEVDAGLPEAIRLAESLR